MKYFSSQTPEQQDDPSRGDDATAVLEGLFGGVSGGLFDIGVATAFINILGLAVPLALMQVFDRVIPENDSSRLFWLIAGVGGALVLEALLRIGRSYAGGWMGARLEHLSGCLAIERLLGANIVDFSKRGAGAYLERLNALGSLREFHSGAAAGAMFDLPFVVIYLGAIYYLAGPLVMVPVVLIAAFGATAWTFGRLGKFLNTRQLADDRRFGFIIEILGGIHTVKGLGMEEQMLRRYERLQESSTEADYRVARLGRVAAGAGPLLSGLVVFGVAGFGAHQVIGGVLSMGGLLASMVLAGRAVQPFEAAAGAWIRFMNMKMARERLREILEMPLEKPTGLMQLPSLNGSLDFEGMNFSYGKGKDGEDLPPVFTNVNLRIEPGQTIGIVGPSACGKTTLLSLMQGLLTPTAGGARIDGYDLRECEPRDIRRQVAYLPQEAVMFSGTVMENLTMFRAPLAEAALDIARLLGLENVIAALPQGFDTPIGVGAEDKLPRGTRQRIAIARALVDKPRILLFDEANSFIDGAGDAALLNLLALLKGRVTLIMVTQRPSMLRLADRILEIRGDTLFEHQMQPEKPQQPKSAPGSLPPGAGAGAGAEANTLGAAP